MKRLALKGRSVTGAQIGAPAELYAVIAPDLRDAAQEVFVVIALDTRNRVLCVIEIARGGMAQCVVDPKLVFASGLLAGASALAIAHNHPSGDATPSQEDIALTRALIAGGKLLALPVVDHLVVGPNDFTSLRNTHGGLW